MTPSKELLDRAADYVQQHELVFGPQLGYGLHGIVHVAESQPGKGAPALRFAIKVHRREADYARERDVYLRLQEHGVSKIGRCHVPQLLNYDNMRAVIAMTIVKRPFVLDFAGAGAPTQGAGRFRPSSGMTPTWRRSPRPRASHW